MSFEDKTLTCMDCGRGFTFTAGEQEFFAKKGLANEPKRCPDCRQSRRQERRDTGDGSARPREMHRVVCASCGQECEVPFEPRAGRPVYCSDCFAKVKR